MALVASISASLLGWRETALYELALALFFYFISSERVGHRR